MHLHLDVGKEKIANYFSKDQEKFAGDQNLWERRVEIQITTVVMHAWSKVEHDIIYKNPKRLPLDALLDCMLDAVNGLSITSEILLQQLQQTMDSLEVEEDRTLSVSDLELFLRRQYEKSATIKPTQIPQETFQYTEILRTILASPLFRCTTRRHLREQLPKLLQQDKNIFDPMPSPDLLANLICSLGQTNVVENQLSLTQDGEL